MSSSRPWTLCAWVFAISGGTGAIHAASVSLHEMPANRTQVADMTAQVLVGYPAESLGRRLIEQDPFRSARRPSKVVYDPLQAAQSSAVVATVPKPALVLTGIVWGASPQAVLEGLPGIDRPRALRMGDVQAGFRIKRIQSDRVTVAGMDTVWVLTVRQPWQ